MRVINCEQRSESWFKAKCGVPSASNFDKIITTAGKPSKQMTKYLYRLAGETITGTAEENYQNATMIRGQELEAEAREFYQLISEPVEEVGFCISNGYGCSPDGLVGKDGLLEIKCPTIAVHIEYLLDNTLPTSYFQQTQGQLLVTGRKWLDFLSYYPGMKPLIIRVTPDKKFLKALEIELKLFTDDLTELVNKLK